MPKVFISYRQTNDRLRQQVWQFAVQLRKCGIEVILDQFELDQRPEGPHEGWEKWSNDNAANTEYVIIIGTKDWFDCFEGKQKPGTGLGAACEAVALRHRIYKNAGVNPHIRIALFDIDEIEHIPGVLQPYHYFHVEKKFEEMVRWLGGKLPTTQDDNAVEGASSLAPEKSGNNAKKGPGRAKKKWAISILVLVVVAFGIYKILPGETQHKLKTLNIFASPTPTPRNDSALAGKYYDTGSSHLNNFKNSEDDKEWYVARDYYKKAALAQPAVARKISDGIYMNGARAMRTHDIPNWDPQYVKHIYAAYFVDSTNTEAHDSILSYERSAQQTAPQPENNPK